ncbi:MAG: hypothetical protein HRU41_41850 [Saprospiraceae bacterium]|nr:hypothetical protein [Saprospiraceae bacterium]
MWSKYKFYIIGAAVLVIGAVAYTRYAKKKKAAAENEVAENATSKLAMTSSSNKSTEMAVARGLSFNG